MKKLIIASLLAISVISCTKEATNKSVNDTTQEDTTFIKKEVVRKFTTPEPGFRIDYRVEGCQSAELKYNTNDGKGWKHLMEIAISMDGGDLYFIQYFRYKWIITRYDNSIWESSERVCTF